MVELDRPQITIRRMRIACWLRKARVRTHTHTHTMCDPQFFSTVRIVTLYVHGPSCFALVRVMLEAFAAVTKNLAGHYFPFIGSYSYI